MISTHAPLAGRDAGEDVLRSFRRNFNPRAPCGARRPAGGRRPCHPRYFNPRAPCGARPINQLRMAFQIQFQPTRPLRGATCPLRSYLPAGYYFNPRAPCGARLARYDHTYQQGIISTHAPLAGRDMRGDDAARAAFYISTHAPLAGRDSSISYYFSNLIRYFNPRAPCGARRSVSRASRPSRR